jgi:predicted RNA-binding Zn ribbon-like protein
VAFTDYRNDGATLAADLVNTLGKVSGNEYLPDTATLKEFLDEHGLDGEDPSEEDLRALRKLRKQLNAAFFADTTEETVEQLNALLKRSKARPHMSGHDGHWHWHYVDPDAPLPERVGVLSAMGLAALIADLGPERLGICHANDCEAVYVDVSKNRSRRFCDDTCSSRTHVAAYRARKSGQKVGAN